MSSQITASVTFSFRGQTHQPSLRVDLDALMREQGELTAIYPLLAQANGFGLHSYEYEIIEDMALSFSAATGIAAEFLVGDQFNLGGFRAAWLHEQVLRVLRPIAAQYLRVTDLDAQPELRDALVAAYRAGQAAATV